MSTIALVVPSYRRVDQLTACLRAAHEQDRPFDEIVVAAREGDDATLELLGRTRVRVVTVSEPGVLAAMRAGADATTAEIVAFTDDDARLPPHWCASVLELFALPENAHVGAVGGRDVLYDADVARPTTLTRRVGIITWWGRFVGNHHRGTGNGLDVAALKGVNAAYRRSALELPTSLRGDGAQAHFEVVVGRRLHEQGWRLRYYSDLSVSHHPAERHGEDQRTAPSERAVADSAYNLMRGLSPSQQTRRWIYVHLVGDRSCPGIVRTVVAVVQGDRATVARRRPAWTATSDAWRRRHDPEVFETFS